jgi:excisionase family DNA binding protein
MDILLLLAERTTPMSVNEAARVLGIHPITLYRRLEAGEFVGYKDGRRWKINPSDVLTRFVETKNT